MRILTAAVIVLAPAVFGAEAVESAAIARAAEKSLALLETTGPQFFKKSGCISCHNVSLPLMAMTLARERGLRLNEQVPRQLVKSHLAFLGPHKDNLLETNCTIPGLATTATYSLISMKGEQHPRDRLTDAIVHCLAEEQRPEGFWRHGDSRPPIGTGDFVTTALSARTLLLYAPEGRRAEFTRRVARARQWLATTAPQTTDDRVFKLFGLGWTSAGAAEIQRAAKLLVELQHADGGWAQLPEMSSDAFATGTALVALHQSGGMAISDPAYQRGLQFLLKSQLEDGSWHVKTRAFGFQPYFESGFPHGPDQWISAAATSWSTMALTLAVPK